MANRSIMSDGFQKLCIVNKQKSFAEGKRAGKVINLHQKQKEAQDAPLGYAISDREQIRGVTVNTNKV